MTCVLGEELVMVEIGCGQAKGTQSPFSTRLGGLHRLKLIMGDTSDARICMLLETFFTIGHL
jgi:hypothetical protein